MAPKVLVLSGRARYQDPWHDHAAQSHALAQICEGLGLEADIHSTFTGYIPDFDAYDLLIVNASRLPPQYPPGDENEDWVEFHEALAAYAHSGKPLLAFHTTVSAFEDSPHWSHIVGGRWIRPTLHTPIEGKTTHHPRIDGPATYQTVAGSHPIVEGLDSVQMVDERYCFLFLEYGVTPFLVQREYDLWHPVGWVNEMNGMRVVYHAPGHTKDSILSPQHRDLLEREIRWLLQLN